MTYIDGVICPVPTASKDKYINFARSVAPVFREHGALSVVDGWGDQVPDGEVTSLPLAVQLKADETVVFSWVLWPSKEVRDAAWEKVMDDPRMSAEHNPLPYDGRRMIFGGFEAIVEG